MPAFIAELQRHYYQACNRCKDLWHLHHIPTPQPNSLALCRWVTVLIKNTKNNSMIVAILIAVTIYMFLLEHIRSFMHPEFVFPIRVIYIYTCQHLK